LIESPRRGSSGRPLPRDRAPERSSAADPSPRFGGFEFGRSDPSSGTRQGTVAPAVATRAGPAAMSG
jgi:hypothetical protein